MIDNLWLKYFISSVINISATLYVIFKILKLKIDLKNPKVHITFWGLILAGTLNLYYVSNYIRYIIMTIIIFIFNYYLFRKTFRDTLATTFAEQFIALFSEIIFAAILYTYMSLGGINIINNFVGDIIVNISISIIMVILCNRKFSRRFYDKIFSLANSLSMQTIYWTVGLLMICANILLFTGYSDLGSQKTFIINLCFIAIYFFLMQWALNERSQNIQYKEENHMLVENLNEYGKNLAKQRKKNHENNNQLLVIAGMIRKKDDNVLEYINQIIKTGKLANKDVLVKVKHIPSAGLQALIHQKLVTMKEKNIQSELKISKEVSKFPFKKISSKTNYDLFRAVGVILDNAIEETSKTKDKKLIISLYVDDGLVIEVANSYKEKPDLTQIDNPGYTTKGIDHGYGLTLLKEIIEQNSYLTNNKCIDDNFFIQQIKIKM